MDIIVTKKQHRSKCQKCCGHDCLALSRETYSTYQLGRPYHPDEDYTHCFDGKNDPRMRFDVRAYLYDDHGCDEKKGSEDVTEFLNVKSKEDNCAKDVITVSDVDVESAGRFSLRDLPIFRHDSMILLRHISHKYAIAVFAAFCIVSSLFFVGTAFAVKEKVDSAGRQAILSLKSAMGSIAKSDFQSSQQDLDGAYRQFVIASQEMARINWLAKKLAQYIPGASSLASGNHIVEAGRYLTHSAKEMHSIIPAVIERDDRLISSDGEHVSFLELYRLIADRMDIVYEDITSAQEHIDKVRLDDVPEEYRDTFVEIKELMPEIAQSLRSVAESRATIEEMLGSRGPRTYLLLFQNNHEMRATGGFIGSYGIVRVKDGLIENMFVDDVYNPDGQLIDRVVPPLPIQKISADWSMHDSNWFAHYPTSAKKAMDFYERSGGPTVDGVIAITPEMMEKFLRIIGPVALSGQNPGELTHENYMRVMQEDVEDRDNYRVESSRLPEDLSHEERKAIDQKNHMDPPKQILADIMPIMLDRLFNIKNPSQLPAIASAIATGLKERHILLYMTNEHAQEIIEQNGWSGSIIHTDKDYLSVVNTNINGFKTDGMISENIVHTARISDNGDVINTVRITRTHKGGHTGLPWWDAVNANYMRVYVPQGAELLSAEGHTRELNDPRLAYDALGYERDSDIVREEQSMHIDEETGTRIYTEEGKTVFGNWVYVSPQETVTVVYTYRLPFKVDFVADDEGRFGSYAILFQKQSGSERSSIDSFIEMPDTFEYVWHAHDDQKLHMTNDLTIDRYNGVVFRLP